MTSSFGFLGALRARSILPLLLALGTLLAVSIGPQTASATRTITVRNDSAAFYISFRCFTSEEHGKKHVGSWHNNVPYPFAFSCTGSGDREPGYVRINRKKLDYRNVGSTWRVHFSDHCALSRDMCVIADGASLKRSQYRVLCSTCPGPSSH